MMIERVKEKSENRRQKPRRNAGWIYCLIDDNNDNNFFTHKFYLFVTPPTTSPPWLTLLAHLQAVQDSCPVLDQWFASQTVSVVFLLSPANDEVCFNKEAASLGDFIVTRKDMMTTKRE